jgi:hypothetical protein
MFHIERVYIQYIQGLYQSGPGTADYALLIVAFATTLRADRTESSTLLLKRVYRIIA